MGERKTAVGTLAEAQGFTYRHVRRSTPAQRLAWLERMRALGARSSVTPLARRPGATGEVDIFDRVRRLCLALPGVERAAIQGRPLFRVGRRRFAIFNSSWAPPRPRWAGQGCSLHFLADPAEADALRADPRFAPSPHHGDRGWFALRLDAPGVEVDWDEVAELLASAHAQVHRPKRSADASS